MLELYINKEMPRPNYRPIHRSKQHFAFNMEDNIEGSRDALVAATFVGDITQTPPPT